MATKGESVNKAAECGGEPMSEAEYRAILDGLFDEMERQRYDPGNFVNGVQALNEAAGRTYFRKQDAHRFYQLIAEKLRKDKWGYYTPDAIKAVAKIPVMQADPDPDLPPAYSKKKWWSIFR